MCLVDGSDPRYQLVLDKVSSTIDRNEVKKQDSSCVIHISLIPEGVELDIFHILYRSNSQSLKYQRFKPSDMGVRKGI